MALQVATLDGVRQEFDFSSDPSDFETPGSLLPSTKTRIPRDFTITTDSYISLCSRVYDACCSAPDFADNVSESAFQYYAVILLWKRFAEILPSSVKKGSEFFTELARIPNSINYGNNYFPAPLQTYLKGIGYFRDPDGCDRRFILPVFPTAQKIAGIPYTFGKVNAKTHSYYEALPAPGIAALRMQADIKYTKDSNEKNFVWDLPEGLCLDIQESQIESAKPTKNLLGWAPAERLTNNQLKLFETCKIDDNFVTNNYESPTPNVHILLEKMNKYFYTWFSNKQYLKCIGAVGLPVIGSLVQGMAIEKHYDYSKFDRSAMYCEGNISVCSPYISNDTLNKCAVISGYRMAKESNGNKHCWSCYDFNEYKSVPESWIRNRNMIYTYGDVGRLNETLYTTGHISKRVLQNECIQHKMFQNQKSWNILQ